MNTLQYNVDTTTTIQWLLIHGQLIVEGNFIPLFVVIPWTDIIVWWEKTQPCWNSRVCSKELHETASNANKHLLMRITETQPREHVEMEGSINFDRTIDWRPSCAVLIRRAWRHKVSPGQNDLLHRTGKRKYISAPSSIFFAALVFIALNCKVKIERWV